MQQEISKKIENNCVKLMQLLPSMGEKRSKVIYNLILELLTDCRELNTAAAFDIHTRVVEN